MTEENTNYASKGAALGTSIPALVVGGLAFLNQLSGGGFRGLSGFGSGEAAAALAGQGVYQNELCKLRGEVAELRSERNSDAKGVALYQQTLGDNKTLRDEVFGFITPLANESAANRERIATIEARQNGDSEKAALREEILRKDIALAKAELRGEIATVASTADCCCKQMSTAIAGLQATLASITKLVVPNTSICPGWGDVKVSIDTSTTTAA